MTKYIKGRDGKFAGSIGDGKNNVPTASNMPTAAQSTVNDASESRVAEAYAKFAAKKNPYKFEAWAVEPNFRWFKPEKASDWDDTWAMAKDTDYDKDDYGHDWAVDYIDGVLRVDPIEGSTWLENSRRHAYYEIKGIGDVGNDGLVMAVWHSSAEDGSDPKNVLGFLTPNGKFYSNEEDPDETLRLSIAWSSVLREHSGETLEDIEWSLATNDDGKPVAFEVKARSEGYRPEFEDPNDEYEPDRWL